MTIEASTIGTYSRVSRGRYWRPSASGQKSAVPFRFTARWTVPGPPLYEASARCQSPSNMSLRNLRYFTAAAVDFSGLDRSSIYQSYFRPCSTAVGRINCQNPLAFARDSASDLNALSTMGT